MDINEVLKNKMLNNFKYYKAKYNKTFKNMLTYSLIDERNMIGGLSRYVAREDKWLLTTIFESCNADYSGVPEVLIMQYKDYFPNEIIKLVEERLSFWQIDWERYMEVK